MPTSQQVARKEIERFIAKNQWTFARSMPRQPHEYLLRKKATEEKLFVLFVLYIREFGYDQKYGSMNIRYADFGSCRYWTMGDLLEGTILINRARIYRPEFPHLRNPEEFKARKGSGDRIFRKRPRRS